MTTELWREISDLFTTAADLTGLAQAALIADRCDGRPDLRVEVESLLAAAADAPCFLETPAVVVAPRPSIGVGSRLGRYRIVAQIGEGGMSAVFRAIRDDGGEDDDGGTHDVAVKVARSSAAASSADVASGDRVQRERQWLRELRHPHIVALVDVDDAAPHLVMELIDGPPITRYCKRHALTLDRRLRLFRDVCAAVQHAHEHGIVHRDLKPANILVTRDGVVKVIDFGEATRLDPDDPAAPHDEIAVPLSPNYASPEQVCGGRVTSASDVYALGVLLYELVTGMRPYEADGLPLDQLRTVVMRTMPAKPSVASRTPHAGLDAIVLKALHKRPERRYTSAGELSADVGRCS